MPSSEFSHRAITSYEEDQRYEELRGKRKTVRTLGKVAVCICSVSTCATIVWLALYMRREILNFNEMPSNHLDHDQEIEEAGFDYFGPQLENFWRAFIIANLGLVFLTSLYIPLGVIFEHYYPIALYGGLMLAESVLSVGNQYMAVSYYLASAIFFTTGLAVHVFVHYLRLDMVDEIAFWKQHDWEELLKRRAEEQLDDSHERSDSFELRPVKPKTAH